MQAIQLVEPSLSGFRRVTLPDPQPGPGEVLVRLRAASLNFLDLALATGNYPGASFPMIPVADGAGEIAALGAGVDGLHVGDRVVPHFMPEWTSGPLEPSRVAARRGVTLPGSLADYAVVPAAGLARLPEHLDFAQGAAIPIAGTTAWNAMRAAQVRPGSTVLILGTGGVSLFALQFAKASGAVAIVVSSSDKKLERARRLGADHLVNYRTTPDWDKTVLEITRGRGADLVVETSGGGTFARSVGAAAPGATIYTVGFVTGAQAPLDLFAVMVKSLRIVGSSTGSVADLRDAMAAIAANRLVPVVDRRFGIDEVQAAYQQLAEGHRHFGKLAIVQG